MIEPLLHQHVRFGWRHAAIHEHQCQFQLLSIAKIAFDHRAKVFLYRLWHLRISVARQIHKVHAFVDQKKVDRLRPAW